MLLQCSQPTPPLRRPPACPCPSSFRVRAACVLPLAPVLPPAEYVLAEVNRAGFKEPSPIQAQGWPMALLGRDLVSPPAGHAGLGCAMQLPVMAVGVRADAGAALPRSSAHPNRPSRAPAPSRTPTASHFHPSPGRHRRDRLRQDPGLSAAGRCAHQRAGAPVARRRPHCAVPGAHPRAGGAGGCPTAQLA